MWRKGYRAPNSSQMELASFLSNDEGERRHRISSFLCDYFLHAEKKGVPCKNVLFRNTIYHVEVSGGALLHSPLRVMEKLDCDRSPESTETSTAGYSAVSSAGGEDGARTEAWAPVSTRDFHGVTAHSRHQKHLETVFTRVTAYLEIRYLGKA